MFKYRLIKLRKEHNLSQSQLALKLNMTQRSVSRFETGETFPKEDVLNNIADLFNVTTDYLLCRTEIKNIYEEIQKK